MAPAKPVVAADGQLASFLFLPEGQTPASRGGCLKFSDGSSKLLSGHRFQDKHVSLSAGRLLLYRDVKVSKLLFSAKSTAAASCKHSSSRHRGGFSSSSFPLFSLFFFFLSMQTVCESELKSLCGCIRKAGGGGLSERRRCT